MKLLNYINKIFLYKGEKGGGNLKSHDIVQVRFNFGKIELRYLECEIMKIIFRFMYDVDVRKINLCF